MAISTSCYIQRSSKLRSSLYALLSLFVAESLLTSCTQRNRSLEFNEDPELKNTFADKASTEKLNELKDVAGSKPLNTILRDVVLILEAESLQEAKDFKAATAKWYEALGIAEGRFGKKALEGWIVAYTNALQKKIDPLVLAKLLLAETRGGRYSPYMTSAKLVSEDALMPMLHRLASPWLISAPELAEVNPPSPGIPSDDPLLVKTAKIRCRVKNGAALSWQKWEEGLEAGHQAYFKALVAQCQGRSREALTALRQFTASLGTKPSSAALAVEATSRIAQLERRLGQRQTAADSYNRLMELWESPGLTPAKMGLEPLEFNLRRIDEALWASRYRALISDYENAKIHAQTALTMIAATQSEITGISQATREQLATLRAEAYHVLAFRIAVEKKDFQGALSLSLLGLQTPNLNDEWQQRLQWLCGVYEYLAGNYESARMRWETQLASMKNQSQRPALYFWLAKTYEKLNRPAESALYLDNILKEFPLSFYATVAPRVASLPTNQNWHEVFGDPKNLVKRVRSKQSFDLRQIEQQEPLATLLKRAEILILADIGDMSKMALSELESAMNRTLNMETSQHAFIYLTRLQYAAGSFNSAIGLTTKLSRAIPQFWNQWPDQLLIYFPRPYRSIYEQVANDQLQDKELLLAISRQESAFTPAIKSSADAIGLMQLIRPTAERFAREAKISSENLEETLTEPKVNIALGSRYLKALNVHYKGFQPAIFAGYNAGEPAVDLWLTRRAHTDPLIFIELVPFSETQDYIKNVWRNLVVYRYLEGREPRELKISSSSSLSSKL